MALLVLHLAAPLTAPGLQAQDPTPDSAAIADPLTGMTGVTAADSVEVANVLFESSPLDGGLLTDAIATRATECASPLFALACLVSNAGWAHRRSYLDPDQVRRDAERLEVLHEIWGYPDASVQESVTFRDGRAMVRFLIEPGAPLLVESIEIRGLERVAPAIPRPRRLPLAPGEPYALPRLDLIRDWVRDRLAERGRPFGDVEVTGEVDETARRARLVVDVRPGPPAVFGAARLDVEPPLDAALVREALRFRAGDLYRLGALEDSERALYGLDIVDRAILQPAVTAAPPPGSTDTVVVPVSVAVFTRDVHAYDVEAAVSSTECLAGGVFWRHRYFLDGPRLFSAGGGSTHLLAGSLDEGFPCTSAGRGTYAEPQYFVQADLQQPLGSDPRTRLHLGASARREAAPEVYVRRGVRGTLGVSRDVAPSLHGLLRFAPAWNEMDAADAYYCGTYGICDFTGIHELEGPSWLNPVELIASWSPAGEPGQTVVPSELRARSLWGDPGWRPWARAGLEAAGGITGSSFEYVRGIAEAAAVRPFGTALEAGVRVRAAWLSGDRGLPPLVRLYAGGVNSQRGVAENLLGPRILVTRADQAGALGCLPVPGGCPEGTVVGADRIRVRPTGGHAVLEASAEGRWWLGESLQVAAFLDYGAIRRDALVIDGTTAIEERWWHAVSPGVGIRVLTGLGPIRLDVGLDTDGVTGAPLFAETDDDLMFLGPVRYDPYTEGDAGGFTRFVRRLQVHVGIGQPF